VGWAGEKSFRLEVITLLSPKWQKANRPEHSNDRASHDSISDHQKYIIKS
jgi:hypothetical protein